MLFPGLTDLVDVALLLLRVTLAAVFGWSGWGHLRHPEERADSIGLSPRATGLLGAIELGAAAMLAVGLWAQLAALALIGVMAGALYKKLVVWQTGPWGEEGNGWYYELLYITCCLVVLATAGGELRIA